MNKEKKAAWVAALRSGEYKQTGRSLCRMKDGNRSYCCLGVLSDLSVTDGVGEWETPSDLRQDTSYVLFWNEPSIVVGGYYTRAVRQWAGMTHDADKIEFEFTDPRTGNIETFHVDLAGLNDSGFTFNQIADVIDYFL